VLTASPSSAWCARSAPQTTGSACWSRPRGAGRRVGIVATITHAHNATNGQLVGAGQSSKALAATHQEHLRSRFVGTLLTRQAERTEARRHLDWHRARKVLARHRASLGPVVVVAIVDHVKVIIGRSEIVDLRNCGCARYKARAVSVRR